MEDKLIGLDLFSGIGGLALALDEWVESIAYCESDRYAQSILLSRMHDESLPKAPIWDDVRTLDSTSVLIPAIDIVTAGFPCQDLSAAGLGRGLAGERSGLYFEIERLIRETKPSFVFLENVPAIRTRGLGRVVWGLSELGYDCRWTVVSAAEVGAPHLRKRWFLLAHRHGNGFEVEQKCDRQKSQGKGKYRHNPDRLRDVVADALGDSASKRLQNRSNESIDANFSRSPDSKQFERSGWWEVEPDVGRVVDGVPKRVDRLKCLGNSVVPAQAREAFKRLSGLD